MLVLLAVEILQPSILALEGGQAVSFTLEKFHFNDEIEAFLPTTHHYYFESLFLN
jgi:hypothetical protein